MGGDSGFEAGELCFAFGGAAGAAFEGEKMKKNRPMISRAASANVMGFVRRKDREMAMTKGRGHVNWPTSSLAERGPGIKTPLGAPGLFYRPDEIYSDK